MLSDNGEDISSYLQVIFSAVSQLSYECPAADSSVISSNPAVTLQEISSLRWERKVAQTMYTHVSKCKKDKKKKPS
jgi:hypothetical protein